MEEEIDFNQLMENDDDFPVEYGNAWAKFIEYCKAHYSYLLFEKIRIRDTETFIIACRPLKDASVTTELALVKLHSADSILYKPEGYEEWFRINKPMVFAKYLAKLLKNSSNQKRFEHMKSLNNKEYFEGFLCEDEPYEITHRSIKFKISKDESDKLFLLANEERVNELSSDVVVFIIPNDYPPTLSAYDASVLYSCFTFQGFLFEPQEIRDMGNGHLSFKGKFLRNMRM